MRRPPCAGRGTPGLTVAAAISVLATACASFGGARPRYTPLVGAVLLTTSQPAAAVVESLRVALDSAGLAVAVIEPREGYLESRWYDLDEQRSTPAPFTRLDRQVRLRFFVDPEGFHTRVVAECVRRLAWDPSRPERELEAMVPEDHPGRALLDRVLAVVDTTTAPSPMAGDREPDE